MTGRHTPGGGPLVVDGTGMLCVTLLLHLRRRIADAPAGTVVHVIATDGPAGRRGTTIIAACSVSDGPPTVLACLNRENLNNDVFVENGNFALNTLAVRHEPMAVAFSGVTGLPQDERFALGRWDTMATGAPTLADALAVFDCELIDTKDLATHRVLFGKVMCITSGGKINPLIGAAGISAYPMAARVVQAEGQRYNRRNYLLMHAMGANTGGQLGSVMAAAIMLAGITGLGLS